MVNSATSFHDLARRQQFTHRLHRAAHLRRQLFDARLKPFGITAVQWWVLGRLTRAPDTGLTQTQLARALESGKVSVGAMLGRLEALGLIERRDDADDKRIRRIFLTDSGYAAIERISAVAQGIDRALLDGIDEPEMERTIDTLGAIKSNLQRLLDQ